MKNNKKTTLIKHQGNLVKKHTHVIFRESQLEAGLGLRDQAKEIEFKNFKEEKN